MISFAGDEHHVSTATFIGISRRRNRTWSAETTAGEFGREGKYSLKQNVINRRYKGKEKFDSNYHMHLIDRILR